MARSELPLSRELSWLERLIKALFGAPLTVNQPDAARLILWVPLVFGIGAAAYFLPATEPAGWLLPVAAGSCLTLIGVSAFFRANALAFYGFVLCGFLLAGFGVAQWRTFDAAPPQFDTGERATTVVGWIEAVERGGSRPRIRLRVTELSGTETPPERVRVRVGLAGFGPGDTVSLRAVLTRPPGPAAPGGYDPARAAWYDRIALTGFAVSDLSAAEPAQGDHLARALARYRWQLAERIRAKAGEETGGIAAALLTGDRSGVRPEDAETLRVSGLGHILAISGLHMALFAGGIYFAVRFALASVDRYARAHDPRKPAAAIALIAATGYLILSGAAIPTQRAWVMAGVVLIGVMLDRRAFSMRSLALAAMVVIFLAPESVVEAGFQMSFAAVAALIAVYEVGLVKAAARGFKRLEPPWTRHGCLWWSGHDERHCGRSNRGLRGLPFPAPGRVWPDCQSGCHAGLYLLGHARRGCSACALTTRVRRTGAGGHGSRA